MATILASKLVADAAKLLYDKTKVRWPEDELLGWLNDAQRQVVFLKPEANVVNESISPPTPNGTKWTIPAAGTTFIKVVRNMGADGNTPGKAVKQIDMETLDCELPDWHSAAVAVNADHYAFDDMDPKHFYVYPPTDSKLEIVYSASPADVGINDPIAIDDGYANVILDLMLWRAWSKDSQHANLARASNHYQVALQALGLREKVEFNLDAQNRDKQKREQ